MINQNVSRGTLTKLKDFQNILEEWNPKINLISKSDIEKIWERHIEDCLQVIQYIGGDIRSIIDLGSGAGFPGIILALVRNDIQITLVDSDSKKCAFLTKVISSLEIKNATVLNQRIEDLTTYNFDLVTCRAFAPLTKIFNNYFTLLKSSKECLFMKGETIKEEILELEKRFSLQYYLYKSITYDRGYIIKIDSKSIGLINE